MIGHGRWKRCLLDLLDGELPPKEREKVEKHLERCAECRQEREKVKILLEHVKNQPLPMPDTDIWAAFPNRVRLSVEREKARLSKSQDRIRVRVWRPTAWVPVTIAAALVAAGIGFILMRGTGSRPSGVEWAALDPQALVAELAGTDPAILQDVLPAVIPEEKDWVEDFTGMTDQEIEWTLAGGPSLKESDLSDAGLFQRDL
ncbi:MAG: zf-HC2 domain-containing protein [Nitrospirae bacterium]|nr:zf-HC2 domain-containing protein [Nitrospirota bacterium]